MKNWFCRVMKMSMALAAALLLSSDSWSQRKATISGTIRSARTGETVTGASARTGGGLAGAVSNEYGFYSLTLPAGPVQLDWSAVGFQLQSLAINLTRDTVIDVLLKDATRELENVVVSANTRTRSLHSPQMGMERLTMEETKHIPMLLGERDVLKAIQLLPGIKSAGEGNSGFYVRGGAADQNLILLDEAPVYNASHLLGFFSTFNSDAIKDITVYKGGMPAQYGGRLSSVLDIKMNEGNNQQFGMSGGIGLISSKLNLEGPLQRDRSSFLVSARRTYADLFLKLSKDTLVNRNTLYFYDLNAKLNYSLGKRDRLFLSGYFGRDRLGFSDVFGLSWGNATGTLRWNHIFNSRLFSNTSLIYSNYEYQISIRRGTNDIGIFSQLTDWNLKQEFQWYLNSAHQLRFGLNTIRHTIRPGEVSASDLSNFNPLALQRRYSWENAAFITDNWKVNPSLTLSYGARLTGFFVMGEGDFYEVDREGNITSTVNYKKGEVVKSYINLEPRVSASWVVNASNAVKAAYVRNVQNLHLISNTTTTRPTDKWVASTNVIRPEISDQVSLGWYRNIEGNQYELSAETYYKTLQNQIDYRNGADVFSNDAIETQLLFGIGRAYGLEMQIKKRTGKLTGWLSYTLSKTERKIEGINDNNWYNARQDRTHDIAIVGTYKLNDKWTLSANWIFYTGDAVTFPAGKYRVDDRLIYYYTERNGYRMPDYHRLDLGATLLLKKKKRLTSELAISLYNAYGRQNAYTIEFRESAADPERTEAVQTSLFRFIPSVSYNFKF
jgi:hypothetical protein